MSTEKRIMNPITSLLTLIGALRDEDAKIFRTMLIREINNHGYVRSKSGTFTGEMSEWDMSMILERFQLTIRTTQHLERGPDAFASNLEEIKEDLNKPDH